IHAEGRAFTTHAISPTTSFGSMAGSVAIGDLNRTGSLDVVADDLEGKVYAWDAHGHRLWTREANPDYSGKPITPFVNVRRGISHHSRNRTQHGFIGSPVLANLSGKKGAALDVIAAGMDRHVYAWHANGSAVDGFPVLVVDPTKVASVNPATHAVAWNNVAGAELNSGAIIDTPAVGDLLGPGKPAIVVGTNEEYVSKSLDPTQSSGDVGNEGDTNASPTAAAAAATTAAATTTRCSPMRAATAATIPPTPRSATRRSATSAATTGRSRCSRPWPASSVPWTSSCPSTRRAART